jgi:hypothetical protein
VSVVRRVPLAVPSVIHNSTPYDFMKAGIGSERDALAKRLNFMCSFTPKPANLSAEPARLELILATCSV